MTEPTSYTAQNVSNQSSCPACGYYVSVCFYNGNRQPLTTLAWPKSTEEARSMKRLPLSFYRCVDCGHVYNLEFDYEEVPYSEKPNYMFNKGVCWSQHLEHIQERILACLPENPTVIEIGCGDAHLLNSLAQAKGKGRFIGFDPNAETIPLDERVQVHKALFEPMTHLPEYQPDLIISRHVLEHLMNPLGFIQLLGFAANWSEIPVKLFIEVPCIDKVFDSHRTVDFFYEHNSHFTSTSLRRLLARSSSSIDLVEKGYNHEVVFGIANIGHSRHQKDLARESADFLQHSKDARERIAAQLESLYQSGQRVAVWGGTGKAAAFMNQYGLDCERFPVVVDSDLNKVGTYVPGCGQAIQSPDILKHSPVDVIIVATQWRAYDIVPEIISRDIPYQRILLEHNGQLVDFFKDEHPYHLEPEQTAAQAGMATQPSV